MTQALSVNDLTPGTAHQESGSVLSWRPRVAAETSVDLDAAEQAAAALLTALGQRLDNPHMAETPRRLAAAYAELLSPAPFEFTTFPNTEAYDELVLVRDIPVRSLCEHHGLPFTGVAHIGYLPGERILGLSKFARLVEFFAAATQTQERLTKQVADHLHTHLSARGVGVVIEAEHSCMSLRGVRAPGTRTVTSAMLGILRTNASSRAEFLALTYQHRDLR